MVQAAFKPILRTLLRRWPMALPLVLALAGPALGQQAPSPPTTVQGVTVRAKPEPAKPAGSAYNRALNFIESHGKLAEAGKLARWEDPICPMTLGLAPDQAKFVSYRVRHVADVVGAPKIRGRSCDANVEIVFTAEPQKLLDSIAAKRSAYLGFHYASETNRLAAVTQPIQGWYLTGTRGAGGAAALDIEAGNLGSTAGAPGSAESILNAGHSPGGCAGSRIFDCRSSMFANILIVVDASRLQEVKIGPIADYVALLALAQMKPTGGCEAASTILTLLSTACGDRPAPEGLTETDMTYLKGLYSAQKGSLLWLQRDQIADTMTEKPASPPPPAPPK